MAGARQTNTMAEALSKIHVDVAQAKTLADADLPFLTEMETMIVGKLRDMNGITSMQSQGMLPQGGGGPGAQMPPGMDPSQGQPGPPPGMQQGPPPDFQSGGMRGGAGPMNPDELRRILGQNQG